MKTPRRRRTAKKLILPLIALGLMISAMGLDAAKRSGTHSAHISR
jgi:hypothetical protein